MPVSLVTTITMLAFAANSILCRLALQDGAIDAGSFTALRLVSGGVTLIALHALVVPKSRRVYQWRFSLKAGLALFGYALCFSIAYLQLSAGTGALLLFGTVQLALLIAHCWQGNAVNRLEWLGLAISVAGFIYLMLPSAQQPDLWSAALMILSGLCWAGFTLLGRQSDNPTSAIAQGFWCASLLCVLLAPWLINLNALTTTGILLALASGCIASAAGYILWYQVVRRLTILQASVAQLSVPAIALIAGSVLLDETLTWRLTMISLLILGGIGLVFIARQRAGT
ncbi:MULTISPECIES: DMT family transporter [unclassified Vibrio]|uniref:DMT family transporter n=1 Tax=Gammaproteobacteria TaxID=1236 RepID=UPI0010A650A6|nr:MULTISPECIES: DMT family transporter [unclassified Vibrio]WGY45777.1 DMT family transporter [Vibrio sp. ABG19]